MLLTKLKQLTLLLVLGGLITVLAQPAHGQRPTPPAQRPSTPGAQPRMPAAPVMRLGPNLFRVGTLEVDTAKKEVRATGNVNDVTTLEFVACVVNGVKAYETLFTVDTDAIMFNTALLLIGLDKAHARVPKQHFDPVPPSGDRVEVIVEWKTPTGEGSAPMEDLLYNRATKQKAALGNWVYTGSSFLPDGRYLAQMDGVLIGFVHSPAPIIENTGSGAVGNYGDIVLNPQSGLHAPMPVKLTIRAAKGGKGTEAQ